MHNYNQNMAIFVESWLTRHALFMDGKHAPFPGLDNLGKLAPER